MKKLFLILAFLAIPAMATANPFLTGDPQPDVTLYKLTGPEWSVPFQLLPAQSDGSIKLDIATAIVGANDLTVSACSSDPVWGEVCSDPVPFAFTRPSPAKPSGALNLRLIP